MCTCPRAKDKMVMSWYCTGRGACGLMQHEHMSSKQFYELRLNPTKIKRALGAPWGRN
jgi:hypothetical protein